MAECKSIPSLNIYWAADYKTVMEGEQDPHAVEQKYLSRLKKAWKDSLED